MNLTPTDIYSRANAENSGPPRYVMACPEVNFDYLSVMRAELLATASLIGYVFWHNGAAGFQGLLAAQPRGSVSKGHVRGLAHTQYSSHLLSTIWLLNRLNIYYPKLETPKKNRIIGAVQALNSIGIDWHINQIGDIFEATQKQVRNAIKSDTERTKTSSKLKARNHEKLTERDLNYVCEFINNND